MADGEGTASPWEPITNKQKLKLLGKLIEECNELSGACARAIIQGLDERNPESGETNRHHIEKEIADVESKIECLVVWLKLDQEFIRIRQERKTDFHAPWFGKPE